MICQIQGEKTVDQSQKIVLYCMHVTAYCCVDNKLFFKTPNIQLIHVTILKVKDASYNTLLQNEEMNIAVLNHSI